MRPFLLLARPWYWLPAIASGLAGSLASKSIHQIPLNEQLLIFGTLGPGISMFAEVINDLSDRDLDQCGNRKLVCGLPLAGGSGMLINPPEIPLAAAWFQLGVSVVVGLGCSLALGKVTFALTLLGYLIALSYSARPFRLKSRGCLGLLLQGVGYGPIAYHIGQSAVGSHPTMSTLPFPLFIGAWIATIGATADLLDIDDDMRSKSKTLVATLGKAWSRLYISGGALLVLIVALVWQLQWHPLPSLSLYWAITFALYGLSLIILTLSYPSDPPNAVHVVTVLAEVAFPLSLVCAQ